MLYLGLRQLRFICSPQPVYRSWRSEVGPCNKGWLGRLWLLCTCRQCRYVGTDKVVYVQAVPLWRDGQRCVRAGNAVMKGRAKMCTCRQCRYEGTKLCTCSQSRYQRTKLFTCSQSRHQRTKLFTPCRQSRHQRTKLCTCSQSRYQRTDKVVYVQAVPLSTDKFMYRQPVPLWKDKV